jgi:glycerol-3-phosphate dehydrogenase subunit B
MSPRAPELHFDAVVIGAGTAGLVAAARLAERGARVCVLAKGVGSTHLAPGTVDVLGYEPELVDEPGRVLAELGAARPDHPYALLGAEAVAEALQWFAECVARGPLPGYRYVGGLERNYRLPTAVGALRPSALVPETMAAGDIRERTSVCVVGTPVLRDFHAALCAANLEKAGIAARAVEVDVEVERVDQNALGLARRFDDPAWRAAFAANLALVLGAEERVGLPAVLGLRDPHGAWTDLQQRLGRRLFEIPTLPPSVPGMRVFEVLRAALRGAGGRLVLGSEVVGADREGGRVSAVRAHAAGHDVRYVARWFVLATGGFASGGIAVDSRWVTRESVMGLALRGVPAPGEPRFVRQYLAEQPMARVGVAVDGELRAEGVENVLVAGAALPGAVPWREGSGEGIAVASGYRAAEVVLSEAGAEVRASASPSTLTPAAEPLGGENRWA